MIAKNDHRKYLASMDVDTFLKLPKAAQESIFEFLRYHGASPDIVCPLLIDFTFYGIEECESPIEKILLTAISLCWYERSCASNEYPVYIFRPQFEINCGKKKYRADLFCDPHETDEGDGILYEAHPLIIECDGHAFHEKTKKQVAYNNQRDYDLKSNGYDILHFSGSQIFNDPFGCANMVFDYIEKHTIRKECSN